MNTILGRKGARWRRRLGLAIAGALACSAFIAPGGAAASESTGTTFIDETFGAQTDPANFGFDNGARIGDGVLYVTDGMENYTTSVRPFASSVLSEPTLDLRFDWRTAITNSGMKTGLELRDDAGRLVFAIAATGSELRHAVAGPDSDSTAAPDSLNPNWTKVAFDRTQWYTVDLHLDFTLGKVQYSITSKASAPRVMASGTGNITGKNLAKIVAANYYGTGTQSIDNFRLVRPDNAAFGALDGKTVYAFGDSIVYGHTYPRGFVDFVAEREGMRLTKYAVNGATVGPVAEGTNRKILTQVRSASAQAPDFVVFNGSTNDAITLLEQPGYRMGGVSDSFDPGDFDTATYAGSLEATIQAMKQKWPTAQLVYVTVHKLGSRDWNIQLALREVNLQAADKWGVAVADVFDDTTFDTRVDAQRVAYTFDNLVGGYPGTGGTGTHPNIAGITEFYVPVLTSRLVDLVEPGEPTDSGTMTARHSGKCASVSGGSAADGAKIVQEACSDAASQQWRLESVEGGYSRIVSQTSGKCLDVSSRSMDNGASVIQWTCNGGQNQQWLVRDLGGGNFRIEARHSGKCLDVPASSTADGIGLQQWDCHTGSNQQWRL
ncbi:MAG TPA: RICIN domain-containing protein [Glycomyces sp.]|nr:RICIN domain-containing protein [Glycomyces sp.]